MVFYSSRSQPPQKFHCSSRIPFLSIFKGQGQEWGRSSQRSCTVCFLIHMYPIDISRLKSGIRRTPPHLFWKPTKHVGGVDISRDQVKYFSEICCLTHPKYSRVKGGDVQNIFAKMLRSPTVHNCWIGSIYFEIGHSCRLQVGFYIHQHKL